MFEYRLARPEEKEAYTDFADFVFSKAHRPHDFETLIPKVYGNDADFSPIHRLALNEKGQIRALIACLPETLHVAGHTLRAGFIGTVSSHPRARGEGHMKVLMAQWLEDMKKTCHLSVLGGQRQRYEYFGYTPGGAQMHYLVDGANVRHALRQADAAPFSFCPMEEAEGGLELARQLNENRPAWVERDPARLSAVLRTYGNLPFALLKNGKAAGYFVVTEDKKSVCEMALANPEDTDAAVKAYLAFAGLPEAVFTVPPCDKEQNARLGRFAERCSVDPSEMFHIFDFASVMEAYLTLAHNTLGLAPGEFSAVLDGQPVTARVDGSGVTVERAARPGAPELDHLTAQELLLSQRGRYLGVPTPPAWFPLPLFWYAADAF